VPAEKCDPIEVLMLGATFVALSMHVNRCEYDLCRRFVRQLHDQNDEFGHAVRAAD
jgi:hypothetical protein